MSETPESLSHPKWERKWMSFRLQLQEDNVARIVIILVRVSASWMCSRITGSRTAAAAVHVDMKISILQKYEIIGSVSTAVAAPVNFFAAFKRLISTGAASATPKSRFERLQS